MADSALRVDAAVADTNRRASGEAVKRAADVAGSLVLLLLAGPTLLVVALLVKLSSAGPVFFRQERLGRHGRPFRLIKFRTMCADAEAILERDPELLAKHAAGGHKLPDGEDPRVTPIGRVLRRTGVDELPQLFNVLRGEMSLVGPRPIVPTELRRYPTYVEVMRWTRPGLTGPWQIRRKNPNDYGSRAELDSEYLMKRSLGTDARIFLLTLVRFRR